ncbi:LexA repressor-like protein [Paenibacillus larvae subsp. larvae]|nr:LexA repressor-like protein [Paenibacillus larvae subsp. larvae]ETK28606.1 hypothetical protein ERIC1_1c20750 [Paenibacillus larvae subsp. larvae DSM 25719]
MAPFIFWNLAFYTIIRTQLKPELIYQYYVLSCVNSMELKLT